MRILRCGTPWALSLALLACAGDGPSGPSGTLRVRITDSPFSEARAAFVTFSEVSAHRDGGDWETLAFDPPGAARTCDLKRLQGAVDVLGVGALAAGTYTQIRLRITGAALYFDGPSTGPACAAVLAAPPGRSTEVRVPSDEIRLNRVFDVLEGGVRTITLDFDGDRSIREAGNGAYRLAPVISVVGVD